MNVHIVVEKRLKRRRGFRMRANVRPFCGATARRLEENWRRVCLSEAGKRLKDGCGGVEVSDGWCGVGKRLLDGWGNGCG